MVADWKQIYYKLEGLQTFQGLGKKYLINLFEISMNIER